MLIFCLVLNSRSTYYYLKRLCTYNAKSIVNYYTFLIVLAIFKCFTNYQMAINKTKVFLLILTYEAMYNK